MGEKDVQKTWKEYFDISIMWIEKSELQSVCAVLKILELRIILGERRSVRLKWKRG